jgi:hypothetical protein
MGFNYKKIAWAPWDATAGLHPPHHHHHHPRAS